MLGLIHGQLYEMTPLVTTDTEYRIELDTDGYMKAYIGEKRVEYGVLWFSFNKSVDIDAKTGKLTKNGGGYAKIRAIFGSKSQDFDLNISIQDDPTTPDAG